jgi:hypothetical protein
MKTASSNVMASALKTPRLETALTTRLINGRKGAQVQGIAAAFKLLKEAPPVPAAGKNGDPAKAEPVMMHLLAAHEELGTEMDQLDAQFRKGKNPSYDEHVLKAAKAFDILFIKDTIRLLMEEASGKDIMANLHAHGYDMVSYGSQVREANEHTGAGNIRAAVEDFSKSLVSRGEFLAGFAAKALGGGIRIY